jgi:hypothetical protein
MIVKFKAIYKKHPPRAIPNRLASGSARSQKMQNKPNLKTSTIEYQESCIENMQNEPNSSSTSERRETNDEKRKMQNEPNFTPPGLVFCATNLLTYCVTNLLSYSYIQNKPNLNQRPTRFARPNRQTLKILLPFFPIIYPPKAAFQKKSKIIQKNAFCKFLKLIYLTPYTTKTYITFHTTIPITLHEMQDTKK